MVNNNKNNKNGSLRSGVRVYLFFIIFTLTFSSFNPIEHQQFSFDQQVKSISTDWYDLFLKFESKDLDAYPPLSAEKLSLMGIAGYVTYNELQQSFDKKQLFSLIILNEIYAHYLKFCFPEPDVHGNSEIGKLKKLKNSILTSKNTFGNIQTEPTLKKIIKITDSIWLEKTSCFETPVHNTRSPIAPDITFNSENPVLPNWGTKNTFIAEKATSPIQMPYHGRPSFKKALYDDALEVYTLSLNLSNEDKWIAEFWSDDVRGLTFSPTGRWISITNQILHKSNLSAREILSLYLRLGVGMYDAGVICWYNKYYYLLQRPSSFINQHINPTWKPLHANPDFPAYPSGHAVFGAVAATILEYQFGKNFTFTDKSHQNRPEFQGGSRSFPSLNAMAIENAYSRVLLGVHYKEDCEAGLRLGYHVGKLVNAKDLQQLISQAPNPNIL